MEQNGYRLTEEEEEDDSQTWSNQDREMLAPCMGLVKTARSCLKRVLMVLRQKAKCETEDQISQLDDVIAKTEEISPAVDELVSSMYPPMNKQAVKTAVSSPLWSKTFLKLEYYENRNKED